MTNICHYDVNALRHGIRPPSPAALPPARRRTHDLIIMLYLRQARCAILVSEAVAIRAELEKDPEWKNLQLENQKHLEAIEGQLAKAREAVRNRLARERADAEAVKQGRARVAD